MDAADLARWTRFAAKGGIGKCTALVDCVAQSADDLMFLKDDEITVLMQLADSKDVYLGYCEGVVGRFLGQNVHFHSKLKKPVLAKRSSSTSKPLQIGSNFQHHDSVGTSPHSGHRPHISPDEEAAPYIRQTLSTSPLPWSPSEETISERGVFEEPVTVFKGTQSSVPPPMPLGTGHPPQNLKMTTGQSYLADNRQSPTSPKISLEESRRDERRSPSPLDLRRSTSPDIPPPSSLPSNPSLTSSHSLTSISTLSKHDSIISLYPRADFSANGSLAAIHSPHSFSPHSSSPSYLSPVHISTPPNADLLSSTYSQAHRHSTDCSDGEVGVGLSFLHKLADETDDGSSDSQSDVPAVFRRSTIREHQNSVSCQHANVPLSAHLTLKMIDGSSECGPDDGGNSEVQKLGYEDTDVGDGVYWEQGEKCDHKHVKPLITDIFHSHEQPSRSFSVSTNFSSFSPAQMTFPPVAPLSPLRQDTETYIFPTPPTHTHRGSLSLPRRSASSSCVQLPPTIPAVARERRPSASSATSRSLYGEDWDGASDIYDNYRYSRFSMGGASSKASIIPGRTSVSSRRISTPSKLSISSFRGTNSRPRLSSTAAESQTSASDVASLLPHSPPSSLVPSFLRNRADSSSSLCSRNRRRISAPVHGTYSFLTRAGAIPSDEHCSGSRESTDARKRRDSSGSASSESSIYTQSSLGHHSTTESNHSATNPTSPTGTSSPSNTCPVQSTFLSGSPVDPNSGTSNRPTSLEFPSATTHIHSYSTLSPPVSPSHSFLTHLGAHVCGGKEDHIDQNDGPNIDSGTVRGDGLCLEDTGAPMGSFTIPDEEGDSLKPINGSQDLGSRAVLEAVTAVVTQRSLSLATTAESVNDRVPELNKLVAEANFSSLLRPAFADIPKTPPSPPLPRLPTPTGFPPIELPPSIVNASITYTHPSLHELRGGSSEEVTGERRSLFLPHPNAPKAPIMGVTGPKYILQKQPFFAQPQQLPGTSAATMKLALSSKYQNKLGPTIYGTTSSDLSSSSGPVLITFSLDPPVVAGARGAINSAGISATSFLKVASSATQSLEGGKRDLKIAASELPEPASTDHDTGKFAVPRANFFPYVGKSRPRSQTFSAFSNVERSARSGIVTSTVEFQRSSSPHLINGERSPIRFSPLSSTTRPGLSRQPESNRILPGDIPSPRVRGSASASDLRAAGLTWSAPLMARDVQKTGSDSSSHFQEQSLMSDSNKHLLRAKRSPLNLQNNGREDKASPQVVEKDTMQFQHTDFELVRPTLPHLRAVKTSGDSSILGRNGAVEAIQLRSESPATSIHHSLGAHSNTNSIASVVHIGSKISEDHRTPDSESSMDAHRQREQKWVSLMNSTPPSQSRKSKKFKKLLYEGVPSSVRYQVWSHLADGKARIVPNFYTRLGTRPRVSAAVDIHRDAQLYFRDYPQLRGERGSIVSLLHAYLTMVPDVHYTTGLTLIAGHLLILAPEEDAFWIFVSIMDTHLRPYFGSSTAQLDVDSSLFGRALMLTDPVLGKKLFSQLGILPVDICRPWFTSLFVGCLPQSYLDRVWDVFLLEGVPFLFRVGLALISCARRHIMEGTSGDAVIRALVFPTLGTFSPNSETFISLAQSAKLKDENIRKQRVKLEARTKRQTQPPRPSGSISLPQI